MLKSLGFVEGEVQKRGDEAILNIVIKNSKGGSIIIDSKAPMKAADVQDPQRKKRIIMTVTLQTHRTSNVVGIEIMILSKKLP